jgi:hypothetical protein
MKKALLFMIATLIVFPQLGLTQAAFTRKMISSGTGLDDSPRIVRIGAGMYGVTWLRGVNANESRLYGRLVTVAGNTSGGLKSNILGTTIYRYSNYAVTALPSGGFLLCGTRNSDRQIISRFFNGAFGAVGGFLASGVFGYNPSIVPAPGGFLLGQGDGSKQSYYSRLDARAHKLSEPVRLNASNAANGFNVTGIRTLPAGEFLILGYERNPAGKSRAAAFSAPSSASSVSALIPYETGFSGDNLGVDAAVDTIGGLTLFGHAVSNSRTSGKLRSLSPAGRPAAAAKAYPTGETNVYARNYRIISLTGTGYFLASWEEPAAGLIYLRLYNAQGVPVASATTLVPDAYQYPGGIGDVAWDPDTRSLLAVWTQYGATTDRTNIWLGVYRLP